MKKFKELTTEERETILSQHINTELLVERGTLGFDDIEEELENINLDSPFLLPPIVVEKKFLAKRMVHTAPDEQGRWLRTMIRTYLEGGSVWYKKYNKDFFVAELKFKS